MTIGCAIGASPIASREFARAELQASFTIERIAIEGDSITSTSPDQATRRGDFYSYAWADTHPAYPVSVSAQASRTVGGEAGNGDQADHGTPAGNTLLAHVSDDIAFDPDLITVMIGANDFQNTSPATYRARLVAWAAQVRTADRRIAWAPPTPYRATDPHPNYAAYTGNRDAFMSDARNPGVWREWADYYIPMGEHPDFKDSANDAALYGDHVHVSAPVGTPTTGQAKLFEIYSAAMASLTDPSRAAAKAPFENVWPANETNLLAGAPIVRRFIVSGIAHDGLAQGAGVDGAELRINGGPWGTQVGTDAGNGFRIYNGDVIDLRVTTSAASETPVTIRLRIGAETRELTYRTVAEVDAAAYEHGGVANIQPQDTTHDYGNRAFDHEGIAVIAIHASGYRAANSVPISVTLDGVEATRQRTVLADAGLSVWTAPVVSAGEKSVVATFGAFKGQSTMAWGVVTGADPSPTQISPPNDVMAPASQASPHLTDPLTLPASGVAVAFFGEYGGASIDPATANVPTVLAGSGRGTFQGETLGIAVASQAMSGAASFGFVFGSFARTALVFKAAGT